MDFAAVSSRDRFHHLHRFVGSLQNSASFVEKNFPSFGEPHGFRGLDALLTPQNSVLILIDHQPFQFANVRTTPSAWPRALRRLACRSFSRLLSKTAADFCRRNCRMFFPIRTRLIARPSTRGKIRASSK